MSVSAWPFLVSRNRTIDYTTIVAPRFINDTHVAGMLAQAAGGEIANPDRVLYREVDGSKVGDLTIVFRIVPAEQRDIGLSGNDPLRDQSGRPIRLIEGIVFRKHVPDIAITREDLHTAHECVREPYKMFWEAADSSFPVHSSEPFVLHGRSSTIGDNKLVRFFKEPSFRPSPKKGQSDEEKEKLSFPLLKPRFDVKPRTRLIAMGLGMLLLLATLGGWFLIQSPSSALSTLTTPCIGTDFATSGTGGIQGVLLRNGADLAITLNHDLGSGYILNVCDKNDVSPVTGIPDPATGVQNVSQFIDDKTVVGLIGPGNSNVAQSEIPLAAQAGLSMVSSNTTNPCLTLQQYCDNPEQVHPSGVPNSFFRICSNDLQQGQADADLFFKSLGLRTAFVVNDSEVYGRGLADAFTQSLKNDGGTILGRDHISNGNIPAQLVQTIVSSKPDAVFYGGGAANGAGRLKAELVQTGFAGPLIGGDGIAISDLFLNDAGSSANNTYATALGPDASTFPQWYTQAYQNYYGKQPSSDSAGSYDAAMVLITAIKSIIKTNPEVMHKDVGTIRRAVLEKVQHPEQPYHGLTGTITFDSNGDNAALTVFTVYAVENGQWVYKPENTVTVSG